MQRRTALWSLLFLLCGCKFEGSCGNSDNLLNTRKGEKVLGQWLEKQSIPAESITCPGDITMQEGTNFVCKAVIANAGGTSIDIRVHQTSNTGDIRLEHASDIQTAESVERGLAGQTLDQTGKTVLVDCGARVRIAVAGTTYRCKVVEQNAGANRAEAAPESFEVEITIKDTKGDWQAQRL
mgnify:CR=1 FL=1|tara:strand:- start:98336 stop:98878 length:543 start_codon:yes stop_codon:yes gene_type:complete